ncbi:MAG: hypothetical protein IAE81_12340 [Caldilineaceae bacterium]|nr:hypothetical protein [Caldilineaceae bacterium]
MNSLPTHSTPHPSTTLPSSLRRRRPFGLYMILILLTVQGLLGAVLAALFAISALALPGEFWATVEPELYNVAVSLLLLLITVVVAFGLWRYRGWGWYGMMLLLAYYMTTDVIGYFSGGPDYVSMLLNVFMVFYLNQREVRDLFEESIAAKVGA